MWRGAMCSDRAFHCICIIGAGVVMAGFLPETPYTRAHFEGGPNLEGDLATLCCAPASTSGMGVVTGSCFTAKLDCSQTSTHCV